MEILYKIVFGTSGGKRLLERSWCGWENIKMILSCEGVRGIDLAQGKV
jgi:hypothetical protein